MDYQYATFQTNELSYLTSCIKTGSYGESEMSFKAPKYDNLGEVRNIQKGDRIFIHLKNKLYCGPFFITDPHSEFSIESHKGNWHKVDVDKTPREFHPVWLTIKPWCFFFDKELSSQVNYCYYELLLKAGFRFAPTSIIKPEEGERLWKFIDENRHPFSDFLQRQGSFAFQQPRTSQEHQFYKVAVSKGYFPTSDEKHFYRTKNGIYVRSKSEMHIANFLHDHHYRFEYERPTLLESKLVHPDFYLPDCDLIIEHLGLYETSSEYRKDWSWKQSLYERSQRRFVVFFESEIGQLESVLLSKLSQAGCKASL